MAKGFLSVKTSCSRNKKSECQEGLKRERQPLSRFHCGRITEYKTLKSTRTSAKTMTARLTGALSLVDAGRQGLLL